MEAAKGILYLVLALAIVLWGTRTKTLSWPLFGWVMLLVLSVGGAGIWCGVVLLDRVGTSNAAFATLAVVGPILLAVAVITFVTIRIARYYERPSA